MPSLIKESYILPEIQANKVIVSSLSALIRKKNCICILKVLFYPNSGHASIYLVGNPLQRTNENHWISIPKDVSVFQGYLNQGYAWGRHVSLNKYLLTCSSALPGTLMAWTVYLAARAPRPLWRRTVCSPEALISFTSVLQVTWRVFSLAFCLLCSNYGRHVLGVLIIGLLCFLELVRR